jgi:alkylhydroperoxidase family enzyme
VPRLRQVPKDEATAPIVTTMYEWLFEGRDPVAEPGRWDGTTGDWWTVFALVPDVLDHAVKGFGLYQSPTRILDPELRELGQIRTGWAAASQFVFSQHAKSMRELGMPEEKITSIPAWMLAECYSPVERAVLAYTDCLVYDHGRVPDALFAELKSHLSDEAILELTYITTLYFQHAVMSRALRTEFDDREEVIREVPGPPGASAMHPGPTPSGSTHSGSAAPAGPDS